MSSSRIIIGDCRNGMATLESSSIDSIVTDPPYELGFMGRKWDDSGIAYSVDVWREALRVLKPGGHLLAFGGTRTYHRLACAIEDAGFDIRDSIHWTYGSGFPKSLDVSKAIDRRYNEPSGIVGVGQGERALIDRKITAPRTDAAKQWDGWGTALKPSHEPIVVARKPLIGTVAANVLEHGTGALNVDGCRVPGTVPKPGGKIRGKRGLFDGREDSAATMQPPEPHAAGRWPPNTVLTHAHDCQRHKCAEGCPVPMLGYEAAFFPAFFYHAKAGRDERGADNIHPTVKPIGLMQWLCRLVTPPGGTVLDPFSGSGSTGCAAMVEGFSYIGCELSAEYAEIARARIEHWRGQRVGGISKEAAKSGQHGQLGLFNEGAE